MGIGTPSIHNKIPRPIAVSLHRHCRLAVVTQRSRLTLAVKQCVTCAKGPLKTPVSSSIADATLCKRTQQTCARVRVRRSKTSKTKCRAIHQCSADT